MKKKNTKSKSFIKSITFWVNFIAFLVPVLDLLTNNQVIGVFIKDQEIASAVNQIFIAVLALGNIILRKRTSIPMSFKLK